MKTKITTCIVVALMLLSGVSQAQKRNRAEGMQKTMTKLTDAQKEELKAAKVEFAKATIDVKNELNELKAHQKTLMSAEKLDQKKIFENIDKVTALQKQLMEERINMRLATSGLLGDNQRMNRGMRADCSKKDGQQMRRGKGQMNKGDKKSFGKKGQQRGGDGFKSSGNQNKGMKKGNRDTFGEKGKQRGVNLLALSEGQQEQMKNLKLEYKKGTQNLREQIQELRLKQKHLLNDEIPNKNEISSNLDQISKVQNQLAKERVLNQQEIRKVLDKDQLVLFLSKPHKMGKNKRSRM